MKKSTPVKKVAEGYQTRLRFGKGQRERFVIKLQDEQAAQHRADVLQVLANHLARAGKHAEAPIILLWRSPTENPNHGYRIARVTARP